MTSIGLPQTNTKTVALIQVCGILVATGLWYTETLMLLGTLIALIVGAWGCSTRQSLNQILAVVGIWLPAVVYLAVHYV